MTVPTQNAPDPTGTDWQQPPWDQRITYTPLLQYDPTSATGGLKRGYIRQSYATTTSGPTPTQRTFTFLYNPSSVNVSHTISTSDQAYNPPLRPITDPGTVLLPTGASVSISLLLDRTYEVSNPANFATSTVDANGVGELGVAADINALYALVGILHLQTTSPSLPSTVITGLSGLTNTQKAEAIAIAVIQQEGGSIAKPTQTDSWVTPDAIKAFQQTASTKQLAADIITQLTAAGLSTSDLPSFPTSEKPATIGQLPTQAAQQGPAQPVQAFGYMTMEPVVLVLGEQRGSWSPVLQYYGYINDINIVYTHFSQRMVPIRCSVDITLNLMATQSDQLAVMVGGGQ